MWGIEPQPPERQSDALNRYATQPYGFRRDLNPHQLLTRRPHYPSRYAFGDRIRQGVCISCKHDAATLAHCANCATEAFGVERGIRTLTTCLEGRHAIR